MNQTASDDRDENDTKGSSSSSSSQSPNRDYLGVWDSFALVTNNTTGPGMMGLPLLFHNAGIIPTSAAIILIGCCSGLCGTMLAETLSLIPGNAAFDKQIEFSAAFRLIIGGRWYYLSEVLMMIMCMVQAISGLVETAQSLDSFFASFLFTHTYAVSFSPLPALVSWSAAHCGVEADVTAGADQGAGTECTPFAGEEGVVLTLGYLLMTLLLFPIGRGNLKDTMLAQRISFIGLIVLLAQFYREFINRGVMSDIYPLFDGSYSSAIPWWGSHTSSLGGVVLFNYAYVVTVPSWLNEKSRDVSVNKTVWGAIGMSSFLYITFGIMAAVCFKSGVPADILTLLASKQSSELTRFCAALFGMLIMGLGVPVFCVIIKKSLISNKTCSDDWALWWGSVFPFVTAWLLYQGEFLTLLLNWTGLLVNGLVAFVLPLVLTMEAISLRRQCYQKVAKRHLRVDVLDHGDGPMMHREDSMVQSSLYCTHHEGKPVEPELVELVKLEASELHSEIQTNSSNGVERGENHVHSTLPGQRESDRLLGNYQHGGSSRYDACTVDNCEIMARLKDQEAHNTVDALPGFLLPYRTAIVNVMQLCFVVIIAWSIIEGVMGS